MNTNAIASSRMPDWHHPLLVAVLAVWMTSCASVPEGTPAMKADALRFAPPLGQAGVYAIRPYRMTGAALLFPVILDDQPFGFLETSSYNFGVVPVGGHILKVLGGDGKGVRFTAEAGRNYFFMVKPGWFALEILPISESSGQKYIRRFKLVGDRRFKFEARRMTNQ